MLTEEQKIIDKTLFEVNKKISDYSIITPINIDEEKEKFFSSNKNYSPQLKYKKVDLKKEIDLLESLTIKLDDEINGLLEKVRIYLLSYCKELEKVGYDNFNMMRFFGEIDNDLFVKAENILARGYYAKEKFEKEISANELGDILLKHIKSYGFNDWKIKFDKNSSSTVNVNAPNKTITIKKDLFFSKNHVKKLIFHEIDTHVLRGINGSKQELKILSAGLPFYLATEEGLAGYNERINGIESEFTLMVYARSVLGIKLASERGFIEVFNGIKEFFNDEEKAFLAVIRFKRGLRDTSKKGGFLKDHIYLLGKELIEEFVRNNGDIKELYRGKFGINDLKLIKKITKPAFILPQFLKK